MWIAGSGLTLLQKQIVVAITGQCSFCGKSAGEVLCIAGVVSRGARICNECIDHCLKVRGYNAQTEVPFSSSTERSVGDEGADVFDFQLPRGSSNAALPQTETELEAFIDQWRDLIGQAEPDQGQVEGGELSCSFCARTRTEAGNLIAGPQTYICDYCISEAAANIKTVR